MKIQKWLQRILVLLIGVGILLPKVIVNADETAPVLPAYGLELYKVSDADNSTEPLNGQNIQLNNTLRLVIEKENTSDITAETNYIIPLPEGIKSPSTSQSYNMTIDNGKLGASYQQETYATLTSVAGERNLQIVFHTFTLPTENGDITLENLTEIKMAFDCALEADPTKADDQGKIEITLPGGKKVSVTVQDWQPKGPEIAKSSGTFQADGKVTGWSITYNHPTATYQGKTPAVLVDELPEGMIFDQTNVNVAINGSPITPNGLTFDSENRVMTYTLAQDVSAGDKVDITYDTKITDKELNSHWGCKTSEVSYTNEIKGMEQPDGTGAQLCSVSANVALPADWSGRNMLSKDGTLSRNAAGDFQIEWTVTVSTAGNAFTKLFVLDTMGSGLTLQPESVFINGTGLSNASHLSTILNADGTHTMTIKLIENAVGENANRTYTITYITAVDKDYFEQTGSKEWTNADVSNSATLEYAWPNGDTPGNPPEPPTIIKEPGNGWLNSSLIQKSGVFYNPTDQSLTWRITVNPNKVNLTTAQLVDDLSIGEKNHLFVLDLSNTVAVNTAKTCLKDAVTEGLESAGLSPESTLQSLSFENNKLTIDLKNIGTKTVNFAIKTYVKSPQNWAANTDITYSNEVIIKKNATTVENTPIAKDMPAKASQKVITNVLKKEGISYDAGTKKITWKLTVNESSIPLGNVELTDSLPDGLSLIQEDIDAARLDGRSFSETNSTFAYDHSSREISISLKNVTAPKTITFTTTVDTNLVSDFKEKALVAIANQASMTSDVNSNLVESNQATIKLENKVLSKTAVEPNLKNGKNSVEYTVKFNPHQMYLLQNQDTPLCLTDTLGDGLYLDLDTVKIYEGIPVSRWNATAKQYDMDLTKGHLLTAQPDLDFNAKNNSFSLKIPSNAQSCVIEYTAYATRTGVNLNNNVQLLGSIMPAGSNLGTANSSFCMNAYGSARFSLPQSSFFSIYIKNVNENDATLQGASFGLYSAMNDSALLVKSTCDTATGICTLAIPRSLLRTFDTLYWKQLTSPINYDINDQWNEIDVANPPTGELKMVNITSANKDKGSISILKTDGTTPLTGAKFELYTSKSCRSDSLVQAATAVDTAGKLTFRNLYPTKTYWLKETSAPIGYALLDSPVAVTAEQVPTETEIINVPANASLEITKVDAQNTSKTLADVKFRLYQDRACLIPEGAEQITDANGVCTFGALQPNTTYYLKEIEAKEGYVLNNTTFSLTTAANNQMVSYEIGNYLAGVNETASLELTKTGPLGTERLENTVFQLYGENQTTLLAQKTTNEKGMLKFEGLKEGVYYLKEIKAPNGYKPEESFLKMVVRRNTAEKITVVNQKIAVDAETTPASGFNVKPTSTSAHPSESTIPKTGVEDHISLWLIRAIAFLLVAAAIFILLIIDNRKAKK